MLPRVRLPGMLVIMFVLLTFGNALAQGKERSGEIIRRRLASGDSLKAYAEARRLTVRIASEVAGRQIRAILHDYDRNDGRFFDTLAYRRLKVVARDAWPFLRDEWNRMEEQPPGEARNRMKHMLESCWRATSEERALGLLADHALENRDVFVAKTVQDISRRYEWDWVDSDAGPKECEACVKRFEKWWKRYAPEWRGMMEDRYGGKKGRDWALQRAGRAHAPAGTQGTERAQPRAKDRAEEARDKAEAADGPPKGEGLRPQE